MRQSNVIFGTLLFAFLVYVTMRGQLPQYLDLFKAKPQEQSSSSGGGGILSGVKKGLQKGLDILKKKAVDLGTKAITGG